MKREALRVTSTIPVAPTTLYFAWIDSEHHSSMTGATAKIDPVVGAKYSACNGYVTGKLVILDLRAAHRHELADDRFSKGCR